MCAGKKRRSRYEGTIGNCGVRLQLSWPTRSSLLRFCWRKRLKQARSQSKTEQVKIRRTCITHDPLELVVRSVVELGAGSALPSLLAATLPNGRHASLVVVTEYPEPSTTRALTGNVERARERRGKSHPTLCHQRSEESEDKKGQYCKIEYAEFE